MWRHVIAVALGAYVVFTLMAGAQAQVDSGAFPEFNTPRGLRPYADEATILNSVKTVLALLKSARFESNNGSYTSADKTYDYDYSLKARCDTPEIRAFYRGLHLAHMAYNLFLSKQEVGWPEDKGAVADFPHNTRHFASAGRNLLFRYWSAAKLGGLVVTALPLLDLNDEQKGDLIAFLTTLREYRAHHQQLTKLQAEVDSLFARESSSTYSETLPRQDVLKQQSPEQSLLYNVLSRELRELINRSREPGVPAVSECYISEAPFRLLLGTDGQIESVRLFTPVKYMVSFWRRRAAEGTEEFADSSIGRVIVLLGGNPQPKPNTP